MHPDFRAYPLDGAMLYFHPPSGTHVRIENEWTRALRRVAPRVVMFGITNACNLRCSFCSRDTSRPSLWSVGSAAELLEGLHAAGTLEVAFGGGEPFAFRGFPELLERLARSTQLALNITTNGTLLRTVPWARLDGMLGQIRLSIYEEQPWREAATCLHLHRLHWGANVLVDEILLARLPQLLRELALRGCHDVSILSYVGPDAARHLTREGDSQLAMLLAQSPLPVRLSVCLGDRLGVPRLFDGADGSGDCGAGHDFLSIGPDQCVHACSFHHASFRAETADEVLHIWREQRALREASERAGCARRLPSLRKRRALPEVCVWQGFSGNNSGECVMLARFDSVADAETYLTELLPGYAPGESYCAPWRELFARERVATPGIEHSVAPEELSRIGSAVVARTMYAAEDDFPELRALAWKRGADVAPRGIHEHETPALVFAIRCVDREDARTLAAVPPPDTIAHAHGELVVGAMPLALPSQDDQAPLAASERTITAFAAGRPLAVDLHFEPVSEDRFRERKKRLGVHEPLTPRLLFQFWDWSFEKRDANTTAFLHTLEDVAVTRAGETLLIDAVPRKKRLAVLGYRAGATVSSLHRTTIRVPATFWIEPPPRTKGKKAPEPTLDPDVVQRELSTRLRAEHGSIAFTFACDPKPGWQGRITVSVETSTPAAALRAYDVFARSYGARVTVFGHEVDSLSLSLARVVEEVSAAHAAR